MSQEMTEDDFLDWLECAAIHINYCRYGQLGGHGFACISAYDWTEELEELVADLDGGDLEALDAAEKIESMRCWIGKDRDPAKAMQNLLDKMRAHYFSMSQ